MSWRATSWAAEQKTGSPISKLVLLKLADNANDEGICWPSLDTMSDHTELSRRTVQEHLARLEGIGLIRIEERKAENGASLSNKYRLNLKREGAPDASPVEGAPDATRGARGARENAPGSTGRVQVGAPHIDEPPSEPIIEPSHAHARDGTQGEADFGKIPSSAPEAVLSPGQSFELEWAELKRCPGFVGDDPAREAASRARALCADELPTTARQIEAIRAYAGELRTKNVGRAADNPHFVVSGQTWYREKRWRRFLPKIDAAATASQAARARADAVTATLGADIRAKLRRAGMREADLNLLGGVTFEAGPPPRFVCPSEFTRNRFSGLGPALDEIWPGVRVDGPRQNRQSA